MTTKRKLTFAGMLIAFCLLLCCAFGVLFSTTGGNTAYAYSSSTKYKLDLTATGTSGIYIYVSGASGSGTVSDAQYAGELVIEGGYEHGELYEPRGEDAIVLFHEIWGRYDAFVKDEKTGRYVPADETERQLEME